ncbi:MAG: nuclease-related domain-containing protein [Actinomycetota bacterium]
MVQKRAGDYSRRKLLRLGVLVGTLTATALALAVAGFWWWPTSLIGLPLLWVVWRETDPGGLLDPLPHLKGVRGEQSVGKILEVLDDRYRVLHGIDTGRGNVDHVVIGPTGVFAIETKNVRGRFQLRQGRITHNGYDASSILTQARAGAMAVRDRLREAGLDRWVEAVVASTDADVENDRLQAGNVTVLPSTSLRSFIVNRRIRLSAAEVDRTESAIQGVRGISR